MYIIKQKQKFSQHEFSGVSISSLAQKYNPMDCMRIHMQIFACLYVWIIFLHYARYTPFK